VKIAAFLLCTLLALAACGKRGDPDPPVPDSFPNQYPKAEAVPELKTQGGIPVLPKPEQRPSALSPLQPLP
jgi:hypothetical protein